MIPLHPFPDVSHDCPSCHVRMEIRGWHIPGLRNLADLQCPQCKTEFFGDLPAGHGLYYPMLINTATGDVHDQQGIPWFAQPLKTSFAARSNKTVSFHEEQFRPLKHCVLLNCLDSIYGHCILKLLNAQYYLDRMPELELIVLVPRFLRWMVPEGVAAIWTVDIPLGQAAGWNDWLAGQIKERVGRCEAAYLSIAFMLPHPDDFRVERFTRVSPFDLSRWSQPAPERPRITFIWRPDRPWECGTHAFYSKVLQLAKPLLQSCPSVAGWAQDALQEARIAQLGRALQRSFPKMDFAVAGMGTPGRLPDWIKDVRHPQPDEAIERGWCQRYSESHLVVGVHGSHLLLPSGHAGGLIQLLPEERWGNLMQDVLCRETEVRSALFRNRFLPIQSSPQLVAKVASSLIQEAPLAILNYEHPWCDHLSVSADPFRVSRQRREWTTAAPRQL